MELKIREELDGASVLEIMRRVLGISRATVKHLKFIPNGIMLNGSHVTVRARVRSGDILTLALEDTQTPDILTPVPLDIDIAYEDGDVVVPSKPANMPTHQSHGHYGDTVANALSYRYTSLGIPFVFRPVNRLDRNTSGLLLIARNRLSAARLSDAMKCGSITKRYVAVLCGGLDADEGIIDTYMKRTEQSVIVRRVCTSDEGGDRAVTSYRVLCKSDTHTLVCASPITGRTHQLRVHFASLGAPIEGDDMYGRRSEYISRHALHSFELCFPLTDGSMHTVHAPLPQDMLTLIKEVFSNEQLEGIPRDVAIHLFTNTENEDIK